MGQEEVMNVLKKSRVKLTGRQVAKLAKISNASDSLRRLRMQNVIRFVFKRDEDGLWKYFYWVDKWDK